MPSVLQEWVMELPLRVQGTLLTGIRCCDLSPKNPICVDEQFGCSTGEMSAERHLHAFLRYCTLVPADPREIDVPWAWFQSQPPANWKPSQFGHYPLHWFSHLMHCFEVVGYCHPDAALAHIGNEIYRRLVRSLHLEPETKEDMLRRLQIDRIAAGEVVS
jgi:hypothetical protein